LRSDAELVRACLERDQAAWNDLVERYARLVYSTARQWGLGPDDVDDAFQAVFMTLFQRLASIREVDRLASWIITTTRRECWRLSRRQPGSSAVQTEPTGDLAEADPAVIEERHLVWLALEELGGPCEQLLRALFARGEGEGYARIAARLGMEIGSIGPTRARCFRKLERILTRLGVGPTQAQKQSLGTE